MSTTTIAPSRKVFETPELLSLVCGYATERGCLSLLLTSKSGFLAAAPFVWEEVDGLIKLLKLLPGTKISTCNNIQEIVRFNVLCYLCVR